MKNRKMIVVAFLVAAMLVVGVGYAAVTGNLSVSGSARYIGSSEATEIRNSIEFASVANETHCTVSLIESSAGVKDSADMTVEFHDTDASTRGTHIASADFTVIYDSTDNTLPAVQLTSQAGDIATGASNFKGDVTITSTWLNAQGNVIAEPTQTLQVGQTAVLRVTVTYVEPADIVAVPNDELANAEYTATFGILVPFESVIQNP